MSTWEPYSYTKTLMNPHSCIYNRKYTLQFSCLKVRSHIDRQIESDIVRYTYFIFFDGTCEQSGGIDKN